jgi:steroid delta-isomerase-like uncharacterized protein
MEILDQRRAAMSNQNAAAVRRFIDEVWNRGKLEVIDEIFTPDFLHHQPDGGQMKGRDALKQMVGMFREALPDLQCTVEDQFAEADRVATRWSVLGTHKGELMGVAPTGKQVSFWGTSIHRFEGGKIAEAWGAYDILNLMKQIGAT